MVASGWSACHWRTLSDSPASHSALQSSQRQLLEPLRSTRPQSMHSLGGLPQSAQLVLPFRVPLIDLPHPSQNLSTFAFGRFLVLRCSAWQLSQRVASGCVVWVMSSPQAEQFRALRASLISWVALAVRCLSRHVLEQYLGLGPVLLVGVKLSPHWAHSVIHHRRDTPKECLIRISPISPSPGHCYDCLHCLFYQLARFFWDSAAIPGTVRERIARRRTGVLDSEAAQADLTVRG